MRVKFESVTSTLEKKPGVANGPQMIQNCDLVGNLYVPVSKIGPASAIKWQEKGHLAMILICDLEIEVPFLAS